MDTTISPYGPFELVVVNIPAGGEDDAWSKLRMECPDLSERGVETLRSGLDGFVSSIVLEKHYICKDYRNLYSNFYSKKFVPRSSTCARLHFFSVGDLTAEAVVHDAGRHQEKYMGFSVIQPIASACLGRTVIDPLLCGHDPAHFYCLRTKFAVHLQGAEYWVFGYPYISQSAEATVCSHSALWGVCRYLSERYSRYGEFYPYDMIRMADDRGGRRMPYHGLNYNDYSTILIAFGCHPVIRRPKHFGKGTWTDDKDDFLDIYAYVESGFPVLLSFRGHVSTAIGHTSRDTLAYNMTDVYGFHDSYALLDQYVMVDDNFFPYQFLGDRSDGPERNYGKEFAGSSLDPYPSKEDIFAAVVPLPEKAFLEPQAARSFCTGYFGRAGNLASLKQTLTDLAVDPKEPLITRLFLTSAISFKRRKCQACDGSLGLPADPLSALSLWMNLPHFIWVMEISPLSLYKRQIVVGEIVVDASAGIRDQGFVYARIGNNTTEADWQSPLPTAQSFRQYTHNLGER